MKLHKDKVADNFFKKISKKECVIKLYFNKKEYFIDNIFNRKNLHLWIIDNPYKSHYSITNIFDKGVKEIWLSCSCLPTIDILIKKENLPKFQQNIQMYSKEGRNYTLPEFYNDSSFKVHKDNVVITRYIYTGTTKSGNQRKDGMFIKDFDSYEEADKWFSIMVKRDQQYRKNTESGDIAPYKLAEQVNRSLLSKGISVKVEGYEEVKNEPSNLRLH